MPLFPTVKPLKRQKGTILITVMLLFAIGAYMATEITYRQKVDIQRSASIFAQAQAYEYVLGAEEIARFALREDLKKDKDKDKEKDHPDEDWGMQLAQIVDGGTIEGRVNDLQGRFNLNWLRIEDETLRKKAMGYLSSLMAQLKIPKDTPAQAAIDQIRDYLDEDSEYTFPDGKDDQELMLEDTPRRAAGRMILDVSELFLIPALKPSEVEILAPYVTALPVYTPLNLNTAPDEVLASIDCLDAGAIRSGMPKRGYDDIKEAKKLKQTDECKQAQFPFETGVKSSFFELNAKAVVDGKIMKVRSILYRDGSQDSNIKVKVIYRRQVDPYSKV
ncbi:MAG: type II secretion system minor pseudopilin GspK [Ketobacteraceae bacterium]|nr:type II secretion system minor pseudopilin GspK [Ketobacteraceae bacterium]